MKLYLSFPEHTQSSQEQVFLDTKGTWKFSYPYIFSSYTTKYLFPTNLIPRAKFLAIQGRFSYFCLASFLFCRRTNCLRIRQHSVPLGPRWWCVFNRWTHCRKQQSRALSRAQGHLSLPTGLHIIGKARLSCDSGSKKTIGWISGRSYPGHTCSGSLQVENHSALSASLIKCTQLIFWDAERKLG